LGASSLFWVSRAGHAAMLDAPADGHCRPGNAVPGTKDIHVFQGHELPPDLLAHRVGCAGTSDDELRGANGGTFIVWASCRATEPARFTMGALASPGADAGASRERDGAGFARVRPSQRYSSRDRAHSRDQRAPSPFTPGRRAPPRSSRATT
jgi:hypothetical protein